MTDADQDKDLSRLTDSRFADVPIEITISVGTARPLIRDLLSLDEDAVLPLDRTLDDPVTCAGVDHRLLRAQGFDGVDLGSAAGGKVGGD